MWSSKEGLTDLKITMKLSLFLFAIMETPMVKGVLISRMTRIWKELFVLFLNIIRKKNYRGTISKI
jgi:hypothetical protein